MASSVVDLIIKARDQASNVFGRVGSALGGLGRSASGAGKETGSLTSAIAGGIIQANLLGQALNLVGNAASFMTGKFEEAKKIQLDTVSAAGTFAALTGESYKESEKFVVSFGMELSKIAGALPGATADYQKVANSIMDNVIPAFKDANGVLNKGEFQKNLTDITKQMTLLGISSGTDASAVGMFTARLLDGNIASAKQLLFADNNPAFINLLEQEMKKRGKTLNDMKNLSSRERIEVAKAVSGKLVTKDVIDAASNTVEGLLAGIQSSLFDPTSGVFGLLRDLSTGEGQQNVMTAVAASIKALQGFFDAGASILKALGVPEVDTMMVLYNGINTFTGWVNQASKVATLIGKIIGGTGGGFAGLQVAIQKFLNPGQILKTLDGFLSQAMGWINELFANLANSTGSLLNSGGGSLGFAVMGAKIGAFTGMLIGRLAQFIINLPWGNILVSIGNIALAAIPLIQGFAMGLAGSLIVELGKVYFTIQQNTIAAIQNLWLGVTYTIQEWATSFLGGWGEVGAFALSSTQGFFTQLGSAIADMWNRLLAAIKGAIDGVISQAQSFITNPLGGGTAPLVAQTGLTSVPSATPASPTSGFAAGAASLVGSLYKGHISTAFGGLLGALTAESRNMPSGASLVIANSSEFVLTPAQMSRMMRGAATVGAGSGGGNTFAPVFHISGSDPAAIAEAVLQRLETMFEQQQQGVLA